MNSSKSTSPRGDQPPAGDDKSEPAARPAPVKRLAPARREVRRASPALRFSPTAWAKLLYFRDRDHDQTEIGGFGITPADDPLYIQDFQTVGQEVSVASISFDDGAVADFFDRQVDAGLKPAQFARAWMHTHPGNCPQPSCTDEETFERVFGACQHAVMFIMAQGGKSYARLRFNVGPGGDVLLPVEVDYGRPFTASDIKAWEAEYKANIRPGAMSAFSWEPDLAGPRAGLDLKGPLSSDDSLSLMSRELMEDLAKMEPAEREAVLADLAQDDPWGREVEAYG